MSSIQGFIAANRFGYGANAQTIKQIKDKPMDWLLQQITPNNVRLELASLKTGWNSQLAIEAMSVYRKKKSQEKKEAMDADKKTMDSSGVIKKTMNKKTYKMVQRSIGHTISSKNPFYWRLVDFFSNHFSVTSGGQIMRALAPTLEAEAIAPNISGYFSDMLLAVETHPAMLHYLNNVQSIGPTSKLGIRSKGKKGLNENLAREILELHTLGVDAGYDQADVTEFARALTGWGVSAKTKNASNFIFRDKLHEPGMRDVADKIYAAGGVEQGISILKDLAVNPSTAAFVSRKLVAHFISDEPPQVIIDEMIEVWLKTKGHLPQVLEVLVTHPLSWVEQSNKFKTPREFVISACRSCGIKRIKPDFVRSLTILGQQPFAAGSPAGYKDVQEYWAGPRAMMGRIEWAEHVSQFVKTSPKELSDQALGPLMQEKTALHISRAESKQQAVTLFLMSPEFQKR